MKNIEITAKQRANGEKIRRKILEILPGTIYHLSKQLNLNPATIRYHLSILQSLEFVKSIEIRKNNRIQLLYFLNKKETFNSLHLPTDLFTPVEKAVHFYALTGETFGVSIEPIPEWKEQSIWYKAVGYESKGNEIIIAVPDEIIHHYKVPFGILDPAYTLDKKSAFFYVNACEKSEPKEVSKIIDK